MKKTIAQSAKEQRNKRILDIHASNVAKFASKADLYEYIARRVKCSPRTVARVLAKGISNNN